MNNDSLDKRGPYPDASALAYRLMEIGYIRLFQGPDEEALRTLWNEPGILAALATLAGDPEAPTLARFLAAEILFDEQEKYPPQEQMKQLASVYATALAQNFTATANAAVFLLERHRDASPASRISNTVCVPASSQHAHTPSCHLGGTCVRRRRSCPDRLRSPRDVASASHAARPGLRCTRAFDLQ
jgi:hypothetical protein